MTWDHTHRDGVWHGHADGVICDADLPEKLRKVSDGQDRDTLHPYEDRLDADERRGD